MGFTGKQVGLAHISGFCKYRLLSPLRAVRQSHRRIVGQNIRAFRKRAQLSQEKLAEKADLTYKFLGEVERGYENISLDSLTRIAKALKIKVRDLVGEI